MFDPGSRLDVMRAMVLEKQGSPLKLSDIPVPPPGPRQLRLRVEACGLCRTDLHVADGDLREPKLPLVLGHQIVGVVDALGAGVEAFRVGDRVGVPWLGGACGACRYCRHGQENLCEQARYTGYQIDGGLAEYCVADARFCFPVPAGQAATAVAPLLCAGLIGYRAYRMAGEAEHLGFYGFGSAAHLLTQVARHQGREIYAFTRRTDRASQGFARGLGAVWAGASEDRPPVELDAAILFAPAGELVPLALAAVRKGGTVVCAGIHMSDIPSFPYSLLWGERVVRSVANLTRRDGQEFLEIARAIPIRAEITVYPLERTNEALDDLRRGSLQGSAVVTIG
jgi:propanol-preferring alcohol dehydrogenase